MKVTLPRSDRVDSLPSPRLRNPAAKDGALAQSRALAATVDLPRRGRIVKRLLAEAASRYDGKPEEMTMTTLKNAKAMCKKLGTTISKRDGEYRVNFIGGSEATAYYTDDLNDALDTAAVMWHNKRASHDLADVCPGESVTPTSN